MQLTVNTCWAAQKAEHYLLSCTKRTPSVLFCGTYFWRSSMLHSQCKYSELERTCCVDGWVWKVYFSALCSGPSLAFAKQALSIHSRYSCFIFTFQPNVSLAPFDESLRGISNEHWIRIEVNFVNVIVDGKCRVGSSRCPFPLSMVWDMSSG